MPYQSRHFANFAIATGAGTQNVNLTIDPYDLSKAKTIEAILTVTGVGAADAADTFDVYLQDCGGDPTAANPIWNDRAHFLQVLGTQSVASGGYRQREVISADVDLPTTSKSSVDSGTGGAVATRLTAGTVLDGPFLPPWRNGMGKQATFRVRWEVVDAGAHAAFQANLDLWAHEWVSI